MRFLSLFSGIEAASVAWKPLGWQCAAVCEFDAAPNKVLAHHYPSTPNLGDITKITEDDIRRLGRIDLVVFGSPCQDLSVAGTRKGLDGERSGLFFAAMRVIRWARKHCGTRWAVWENVPGAFTSNSGHDFAAVVGALSGMEPPAPPTRGLGYGRLRRRQRSNGRMGNSRRAVVRSGATAPSRVRCRRFWRLVRSTASST
jgi:DNA (cytosine-5)-methyltransferase 1